MKKILFPIGCVLFIALLSFGAYRFKPFSGQMYVKDGTVVTAINTQNVYHFIHTTDMIVNPQLGFSFSKGRIVDADISQESNNGGVLRIDTSASHNLSTNDIVSLSNMNNDAHNGITKITVIDADTFDCQDIPYVADTGVSAGIVIEGAYLQLLAGGNGHFMVLWSITGASSAKSVNYKFALFRNTEEILLTANEFTPVKNDYQTSSGHGLTWLNDGDRIFIAVKNKTDTTNITLRDIAVTIAQY